MLTEIFPNISIAFIEMLAQIKNGNMERITLENINDSVGQTVMYQIGILGFLIYKMTQGVEIQYTIVLVGCVLGIACTIELVSF